MYAAGLTSKQHTTSTTAATAAAETMGSFIAKEIKEAMDLGQATSKPGDGTTTTSRPTKGAKTDGRKDDKEEKKKEGMPSLTDEEWETIRSLSNPFS